MPVSLADLRRYAVDRSLFRPTTLKRAIDKLGFVQADPIRARARAQDLPLRHRVRGYRAGDLERRYATLGVEEDHFINYGFLSRRGFALMHPRADFSHWPRAPPRKGAPPRACSRICTTAASCAFPGASAASGSTRFISTRLGRRTRRRGPATSTR